MVHLATALGGTFRLWFYDLLADEHPAAIRVALQRRIELTWDQIDAHLAENGPYLLGDDFSAADLLLTMYLRWSRNMPHPGTGWRHLKILSDRVRSRESWRKVSEIEELSDW
jgi:glutathione S-transferase